MKTLLKLLLAVLALAVSAGGLVAQPFSIDENGKGIDYLDIVAIPPLTAPLPFLVVPDPSGGITNSRVLTYSLPYLVNAGDVGLVEPGQSTLSDLIRFYNAPGANTSVIIFYSAIDGPTRSLADVGIPYAPNAILINETGLGGNPITTWTPTSGQPGSFNGIYPVFNSFSYYITSDAPVPEPGSAALLIGGAGIWFGLQRCCRRKSGTMASRFPSTLNRLPIADERGWTQISFSAPLPAHPSRGERENASAVWSRFNPCLSV